MQSISLNHPVANLGRCTPGDKQMLPTHKRRQIPRKIFRYICDIVRRSHALRGMKGFYEISDVCADAIAIDTRIFSCCGEDGIDGDASMTNFLRQDLDQEFWPR